MENNKKRSKFVTEYLDKKIKENENFIRCSYYELRIKEDWSKDKVEEFLTSGKIYLENLDYDVYFTDDQYYYNGKNKKVESNELMIAIKNMIRGCFNMKENDTLNKKSLNELDIDESILKILNSKRIKTVGQICKKSKTDLRKIGLENQQVNKIDIELQLLGASLKGSL